LSYKSFIDLFLLKCNADSTTILSLRNVIDLYYCNENAFSLACHG